MYLRTYNYHKKVQVKKSLKPIFFFCNLKQPKQIRQFTSSLLEEFLQTEDLSMVPDPIETIIWVENQQTSSRVSQISRHLTKQSTRSQVGNSRSRSRKVKRNGFMNDSKQDEDGISTNSEEMELAQMHEKEVFKENRKQFAPKNQSEFESSGIGQIRDRSRERGRLKMMSIEERLNERKSSQEKQKKLYSDILSKNYKIMILRLTRTFFAILSPFLTSFQMMLNQDMERIIRHCLISLTCSIVVLWTRM